MVEQASIDVRPDGGGPTQPGPALVNRPAGDPRRVPFYRSITFQNLCIFFPIFLLALAPVAYTYWRDVKENRIDNLATRLELIAEQSVQRLDAEQVARLDSPELAGTPAHRQLVTALRRIQQDFKVDNAVVIRRQPNGKYLFVADGNNQFKINQPAFIHDRFPETLRAAEAAWSMNGEVHTPLFGSGTFEYLQFNRTIQSGGRVVALLMLNKFAEDVDQAIRMDTLNVLLLCLVILLLGGVVFWLFSSRLLQPLIRLKTAANQVAAGNLDLEIRPVTGRDEVSQLNDSFRSMVRELRESRWKLEQNNNELKRTLARVRLMEDVEKNLSKFIPNSVRSVIRSDPEALERGKIEKDVTVLFLDVEGSTQLNEKMEPSRIDHLIEDYFSHYLDFIYENQGDITETAGDGLMIIFQEDDPARHALNAVRTAAAIQDVTRSLSSESAEEDRLRINIGINSGGALVGFTKYEAVSGTRVTFTASGLTTIVAARLQDMAQGGSVLLSQETLNRVSTLPEFTNLKWRSESLGLFNLKNLSEPEAVHRIFPA